DKARRLRRAGLSGRRGRNAALMNFHVWSGPALISFGTCMLLLGASNHVDHPRTKNYFHERALLRCRVESARGLGSLLPNGGALRHVRYDRQPYLAAGAR